MTQNRFFDEVGNENEDDLIQQLDTFEQAVVWGTDWTTETILNQLIKKNIDLNPKFQRRDAWNDSAKSKFIESIMIGLPIPQIILAERKDSKGKYIVIDGKQRLLTIRKFFATPTDEFFEPLKLKSLGILDSINGKTYSDILNDPNYSQLINQLQNQPIRTTVIKNWPNEQFLFTVFLRLNTGSIKLSPQELRQALHPGPFIDFADDFSINSDPIKQMLGITTPDFRMRDVEIVIRYFSNIYFIEQYFGNLKAAFDSTVKTLNDDWEELKDTITKDAEQLDRAISFTIDTFGKREAFSKWTGDIFQGNFNRAVFDIMSFYFRDSTIREASVAHADNIVNRFKELCEQDNDFRASIELTTKSIQNTVKRLNTWGETLAQIIGFKIIVPTLNEQNKIQLAESENG